MPVSTSAWVYRLWRRLLIWEVLAGFCTGGALAIRGGWKAARNGAIGCGILLAVIEGVGIGVSRMMAGSQKPQNPPVSLSPERMEGERD
jgi:hypothetical protein